METKILVGTINRWNKEKKRYELSESFNLDEKIEVKFGGIRITTDPRPPLVDPLDKSQSIILRKEEGKKAPINLQRHVRIIRAAMPKKDVVGETILITNPFYYISNLSDLVYLQIYRGNPNKHPEMIEIKPSQHIGENPSGTLL